MAALKDKIMKAHVQVKVEKRKRLTFIKELSLKDQQNDSRRVTDPDEDFYHCPCGPDDYISIRLDGLLRFYESRIPIYYRNRNYVQVFMVFTSVLSTLLAALNVPQWVPIVAMLGSSLQGWAEFRAISKKLQRYNFVVRNLAKLRLWWSSLQPVDRANLAHFDKLVSEVEDIVSQEFFQWRSATKKATETTAAAENKNAAAEEQNPDESEGRFLALVQK